MSFMGIMQGRLVPPEGGRLQCFPRERWSEEFGLAVRAGLDYIEWICDAYGADANPLMLGRTDQLRALIDSTGVAIRAVCADCFMDYPLVRSKEAPELLRTLLPRCKELGANRIVLPFVDNSAIAPDEMGRVVDLLRRAADWAAPLGIELHLETSLPPVEFASLLQKLPALIKVNYDSGNSSSLGYAPADEFAALGDRIGSVHIKDRVLGGGTVPLETGDADFPALFAELRRIGYQRDFTLQVARGEAGKEVEWTRQNLEFVRRNLA